jgi:hypothetical protein
LMQVVDDEEQRREDDKPILRKQHGWSSGPGLVDSRSEASPNSLRGAAPTLLHSKAVPASTSQSRQC